MECVTNLDHGHDLLMIAVWMEEVIGLNRHSCISISRKLIYHPGFHFLLRLYSIPPNLICIINTVDPENWVDGLLGRVNGLLRLEG